MTTKRTLTLFSLFLFASVLFFSCESDPKENKEDTQSENTQNDESSDESPNRENIKKIFYAIPSPVEMASMIRDNGSDFNEEFMNPSDKAKSYSSIKEQAINLGVYGADISYASMFDQSQATINYMASIQNITNSLGLTSVLDNNLLERITSNKESKDSLLVIVSEAYWGFNGYLKEEQREDVASLVIAGGWVEALHLALSHCNNSEDALAQRIAEQKYSLDRLISLVGSYDTDNVASVMEDLNSLKTIYDEVTITKVKKENTQTDDGVFELNSVTEVDMSAETLDKLRTAVNEIRTNYVQ